MNVTVLEEPEYNNEIDKIIETQSKLIQECPKGEKRYAWDTMKIKIRGFTQKYCEIRNTNKKNILNEIQNKIYVIDEQLAVAANNYEVKSKLDEK